MATFQARVIAITKSIPYGKVTTYGNLSLLAGNPRGARLVAGVLHQAKENLPWYRVINKRGFISIRGCEYDKDFQKKLLEQEGVVVSDDYMVDLSVYGMDHSQLER